MKRHCLFISVLLMFSIAAASAKGTGGSDDNARDRKSERAMRKSEQAARDSVSHILAVEAIERSDYIFKITSINTQKGRIEYVSANVNFLLVEDDMFTFQTSTGFGGGPNNMGGITTKGLIKNVERSVDKHGNVTYTFRLVSNLLNASATLYIQGSSNAGDLYLNFDRRADTVTMFGSVYPSESTKLYEGGYM